LAAESATIRIGSTQAATYIAGISTAKLTGSAVYVTSSGRLGVLASSERYKTAIAPIGSDAVKLEQLRPVSYRLRSDATGTRQYGLIAEEVVKVYPELVIRDANGRIDGVRYNELAPLLLNEVQQQRHRIAAQNQHSADQDVEIRCLEQQFEQLKALNQATMRRLQDEEDPAAAR
jgi:trimeric autotransporter adhesin